ncbi:phage tail protein, partial [Anaerococcus sp.]|uniref:phage tail protein n=1 Tax=Anaerococcus sp. TaxID=1872515 RepID=UPI002A91F4CB
MLVYGLNNETFDRFYFFKNLEIKKEINKLDISCFEIPRDYRNIFETECKVIENKQSYTIKNIEPFYDGYKIECKQNIDEWLSFFHKSLNFPYKDIETMVKGIIPSGWSYKINGEIKKYRTITADHKSSWEVLEEIVKKFGVEFRIDNNEKILFISEKIGEDKGAFFSDDFNIVDKDISVESFEFATRIIPEGMNGLKISQINDGKDYLENKSYSGKTITYYWKDERYTNVKNLKDEAAKKLEALSRPRVSIKLKVKDLSKAIGVYEQKYNVGDYVYLIDKDRKTKERFRILEGTFYPNRPFNNEITLANKPLDLVSDVDENIELTKEMWEETRGRFEATENLIKGYLENSKRYTDDSFKTYKSEREQIDSRIYESITESTTYVDPETGQTKPIIDKQLEIIKSVNGIKITVKNNADNLDKKISKEDILEDKEIQEALKGKDGLPGEKGKDGQDGKTGKIGQNLLRNSNVPVSNKLYNTNEWTLCETPEAGETMTFTAKVK